MAGGTIGSKEHVRPAYLNMKLSMVKKIDDQESSRVQPDGREISHQAGCRHHEACAHTHMRLSWSQHVEASYQTLPLTLTT